MNRLFPLPPLKLPKDFIENISEKKKWAPKFIYLQDSLLKRNKLPRLFSFFLFTENKRKFLTIACRLKMNENINLN